MSRYLIAIMMLALVGCSDSPSKVEISCGPDGFKVRGGSVTLDENSRILCQEGLRQPRPLTIDQNSVVCWKKGPDGWQWEQCARNELTERQKQIQEEIRKDRKTK